MLLWLVFRRSGDGSTAMHMACMNGSVYVLRRLVEAGGDLRLHDRDGKTPRDWAMRQSDAKRRRRALSFIDGARENALSDTVSTSSSSSCASSKHFIELPAGLRFPCVFSLTSIAAFLLALLSIEL